MEEAQIVVDVEASRLSKSMQRKLNKLWGKPKEIENFTIFRAPRNMHESKKNLFEPSVISIGPFHHGQTSLRAMEEQKWRFLRDFLARGDHISLDLCISQMKLLEERTRRCYSETVDLDSNGFVEMMLLDGCFVVEYFLKRKEKNWNSTFEVGWNHVYVYWDLVLLENQIPFFVVEKLCEIGLKQEDRLNFVKYIIGNMSPPIPNYPLIQNPPDKIDHLAHLYHHCSVPNPRKPVVLSSKSFLTRIKDLLLWFLSWVLTRFPGSTSPSLLVSVPNSTWNPSWTVIPNFTGNPSWMVIPNSTGNPSSTVIQYSTGNPSSTGFPNSTGNPSSTVIPCASDLQDAGIKFRPKSEAQHMFDISFDHGVLEIPKIRIFDDCRPLFVNLIALEQCNYGKMFVHFSCFAIFLDCLINTQKDAMILQQCGIIENTLSCEEELTHFFNQLNEGTLPYNNHFLAELFKEVNIHYESSWNRHRAKLIRDYFSSPWTAISLVAALVLLVLTCVQSFFAVYAYYVPPS